jgi:hypothetical protein
VPFLLDVVYTCHDIFDLSPLEGVPFCFAGPCLGASFGRESLACASMGQGAHRLDVVGPHTGSQRDAFGGLLDIMKDLIHPLVPKLFS